MKEFLYNFFKEIHEIIEDNAPEILIFCQTISSYALHCMQYVNTSIKTFNQHHRHQPYMRTISQMSYNDKMSFLRQDVADLVVLFNHVYFTLSFFHIYLFWSVFNLFCIVSVLHLNAIMDSDWVMIDAWYGLMQFESFIINNHFDKPSMIRAYPLLLRHVFMELIYTIGSFEMIHTLFTLIYDSSVIVGFVRICCIMWFIFVTIPAFLLEHDFVLTPVFDVTTNIVLKYRSSNDSLIHQGYCVPTPDYLARYGISCLNDYFTMKRLRLI